MRAWQVVRPGEPAEALALSDVAAPEPGPGFVRVRVSAAALGLPDVHLCRGSYAFRPALPFVPGQELCGTVIAPGPGARAKPGERVMAVSGFFVGHGAFAEEALALDDFCFPVPDFLGDAEAAGFCIPFHTAWVALARRAALRAGETLLVLGAAGGTGQAATQLGKAMGARVIATAGGAEKVDFCRRLGADEVVDYRTEDLAARVRELTGGRGAEVVFDAVGGSAYEAATRCIAHEGRLLLVGFGSGEWGRPDAGHLVTHNYSVLGVVPSGYDRAFKQDAQDALMAHVRAGALRVPVERNLPFEALPEGLAGLARGEARGKWVLSVG